MLSSIKIFRKHVNNVIGGSCQCALSHFSGVSNGSILKTNIDVDSKEYQVN